MIEKLSLTGVRHLAMPGARTGRRSALLRRYRLALAALAVALLAGIVVAAIVWQRQPVSQTTPSIDVSGGARQAQALPELPPPNLFRPLTPEEAQKANAERPLEAAPSPAAAFRLRADQISQLRAIDCLTQAIYYEAASEGVDGGRAVAQVVLNRMRHPGYPSSVCGVVYQGSQRVTGCQFTFTCDGSLARTPVAYLWARSRLIATEALAGRIAPAVGYSTHYHADYVVPYWAASLDKVAVIGRHIFYRLRGASGTRSAFSQSYAGAEPLPTPPTQDVIAEGLETLENSVAPVVAPLEPKVEEDRIEAIAPGPRPASDESSALAADLNRGQLILGEGPAAKTDAKRPVAVENGCGKQGAQNIRIGSTVTKVGTAQTGC